MFCIVLCCVVYFGSVGGFIFDGYVVCCGFAGVGWVVGVSGDVSGAHGVRRALDISGILGAVVFGGVQ